MTKENKTALVVILALVAIYSLFIRKKNGTSGFGGGGHGGGGHHGGGGGHHGGHHGGHGGRTIIGGGGWGGGWGYPYGYDPYWWDYPASPTPTRCNCGNGVSCTGSVNIYGQKNCGCCS